MFTAQDVKKLRNLTSSGILDCKKALTQAEGDFDKAVTILRKSGQAKAGKKADRQANEGLSYAFTKDNLGILVQVQCETDFVAKTDRFKEYVKNLAQKVANRTDQGDITSIIATEEKENLIDMIATIGENIKISKVIRWEGTCTSYIHAGGKVGVLANIEGEFDEETKKALGMHIAAFSPLYITPEEVPAETVAKEKEIARQKTKGKPEEIANKILNGVIQKWYTEVCLIKQPWIHDDKASLEKIAPKLKIKRFVRVQTGA